MHRYVKNLYTGQYKATIGADFLPKQVIINPQTQQKVTLQIWDTAGQERFQSLGNSFYRGADACVLVFDVFDRMSFEGLDKWRKDFMSVSLSSSSSTAASYGGDRIGSIGSSSFNRGGNRGDSGNFPFIVMGNKADKESSSVDQRQVSLEEAREWCRSMGNIPYFETSAKTALNVENAFFQVAKTGFDRAEKKRSAEFQYGNYGSGGRVMKGYVPPHQTVDLNRHHQSYDQNSDCC